MTAIARRTLPPCLLALAGLFGSVWACAAASDFSRFRVPDHRWQSWTVAGDFRLNEMRGFSFNDQDENHVSGSLASWLAMGWESERGRLRLGLSGRGEGTRNHRRLETQYGYVDYAYHQIDDRKPRAQSTNWATEVEGRRYLGSLPIALGATASWAGSDRYDWDRESRFRYQRLGASSDSSLSIDRLDRWRQQWSASAMVTAGVGRVRQSSGVHQARVLESRLLETGALRRRLSRAALQRLSRLFYLSPVLFTAHDRPAKVFWEEVEQILLRDGAVAGDRLGAYDVMRAAEPFVSGVKGGQLRQVGWHVGPLLAYTSSRAIETSASRRTYRLVLNDTLSRDEDDVFAGRRVDQRDGAEIGGAIEVHLAPALAWQIDVAGTWRTPAQDADGAFDAASRAGIAYMIADRWGTGFEFTQERRYRAEPFGLDRGWSTNILWTLEFAVEDRTQLSLQLVESQVQTDWSRTYRRTRGLYLGVSYHVLGGIEAPGLLSWPTPGRRPPAYD